MKQGCKLLTTAPTHTAIYQCNYCAQCAQYVADLEECIHQLKAENAQLHFNLETARTSQVAPFLISLKVLHHLLSQ